MRNVIRRPTLSSGCETPILSFSVCLISRTAPEANRGPLGNTGDGRKLLRKGLTVLVAGDEGGGGWGVKQDTETSGTTAFKKLCVYTAVPRMPETSLRAGNHSPLGRHRKNSRRVEESGTAGILP